jgi:hypothetical protein
MLVTWHKSFWTFLHTISIWVRCQHSLQDVEQLLEALAVAIPCEQCKAHYREALRTCPLPPFLHYTEDGHALFKWSVDFHNTVNRQIGKPEVLYEAACKIWT